MDDEEFIQRIVEKIQRLTGTRVDVEVDREDGGKLEIELNGEVPKVVLGFNVFKYAGFARMCVEYAVASIKQDRPIDVLEFHLLLARN